MGLTAFTRTLLNRIYSMYPDWQQFGKELDFDQYQIYVPVPNRKEDEDLLRIFVESDYEVIIGFDVYHGHFYRNCYESEDEFLQSILSFIDDILNERIVVATTFHHDKGLKYWEVIEVNTIESFPHEIQNLRSWHGTYNKD